MSRVPHSERVRIVELCLKSYTQSEIAELTGRSTNAVNRIIQAYRNEGRICDAPHDRRPRVTSAIEDEVLVATAYANLFGTAQQHAQLAGVSAPLTTAKRRLAEAGLRSRVAVPKGLFYPTTTKQHVSGVHLSTAPGALTTGSRWCSRTNFVYHKMGPEMSRLASCEHSLRAGIHTRSGLKRKDHRKRVSRHVHRCALHRIEGSLTAEK
ncbi:hypothetical protein HPB48_016045 [Haemaphysalis longicornis]|uniref:Transposase n=1 Tax=Haemaphysalis longicornis TaxID=44386 RepID=A0A9J6FZR3_HAELO|nr:hypothetical protein HPB48_016045 [Haemaphysalis longicornis]